MTVRLRNNVKVYGPAGGTGGLTAPTSGEDGYVAIADGGDLTYLPGTNDLDVLTWNDGTQTWEAAAGGGDVHGPASSVDNQVVRFDGETGKTIQGGTNAPTYDDSGNLSINAGTALRFWNAAGTFYVGLAAPTLAASHTLRLPPTDGTAGQALVTDGDGNLSFVTIAGEGGGVTDHGALTGLTDVSDHPGYLLTSGTRTASYIQFGTYPATSGYVRLPHEGAIYSRNYANSADIQLLRLSGSTNYLLIGSSSVSSTDAYATLAHAWHLGSYKLELLSTGLNLYIGSSVASLPAAGYQTFFRYHNTLCVATGGGRSSLAPMVV